MAAPIIVTGAAGFIGHSVAHRLLDRGERVIGVDIVNDYYDPALKQARLGTFKNKQAFSFERLDIAARARARSQSSRAFTGIRTALPAWTFAISGRT